MREITLTKKYLPQNPDIAVLVPNYKEPILPVNHGGSGWYGLMAYNEEGQLMCHECGGFFEQLCVHSKQKHGLSAHDYKIKYGLFSKTKLVSKKLSQKMRENILNHPEVIAQATANLLEFKKQGINSCNRYRKDTLELQNLANSCPGQLIDRLLNAAKEYGEDVTETQIRRKNPTLISLLIKRFGSFNKAKQIARLVANTGVPQEAIYIKQLILEDMIAFYNKSNRWPRVTDYENHLLICSTGPIYKNFGGLVALRREATELRKEQEEARIRGEQIIQYANKLEFEKAGLANR